MNTHTETSECQLLGLTARTIETPEDVESLRQVRNATAWGFSHDTSQISPEQQRGWWATMRGKVRGWLYRLPAGDVVGFGVLRQTDDGRWWNSVGVLPAFAGR